MRKNGVDKEITELSGGVCAPRGFSARGGRSDMNAIAVIASEKKASIACVFSQSSLQSGFVSAAQKRLTSGEIRAVAVGIGSVDVGTGESAEAAGRINRLIAEKYKLSQTEILPLITGDVAWKKRAFDYSEAISALTENGAEGVARAFAGDEELRQGAFSFFIGDVLCKIGFVGRGARERGTDGLFSVITTDVDISPQMLQKALETEMREAFSSVCQPDLPSPSDAVCMLANGAAGNARIDCADTEYKKFADAFHLVAVEIVKRLAVKKATDALTECFVSGAKSKKEARAIARAVASSASVMRGIADGCLDGAAVLCAIGHAEGAFQAEKLSVSVASENGVLRLVDEGWLLPCASERLKTVLQARETYIAVRLGEGNYTASAWRSTEKSV